MDKLEMDPSVRRRTAPKRFAPLSKLHPVVEEGLPKTSKETASIDLNFNTSREPVGVGVEAHQLVSEFPIKVFQTPVSMFEFKSTTKFNVENALSMSLGRRQLNAFGERCAPAGKPKALEGGGASQGPQNSVYGEKERAEAKRQRLLRREVRDPKRNVYKEEINLKVQDETSLYHKMKGTWRRMNDIQGSYYALVEDPSSGTFHAHPVKDWCSFNHFTMSKPLTEEEAEETFKKRHKILNLFSVMVGKRFKDGQGGDRYDDCLIVKDTRSKKGKKKLDDSDVEFMESGDSDSEDGGAKEKNTPEDGLGFISKKIKKRKSNKSFGPDLSGSNDNFEFDNSSGSDSEDDPLENYQLGVDEEEGLRDLLISDESDDEELVVKDAATKNKEERPKKKPGRKKSVQNNSESGRRMDSKSNSNQATSTSTMSATAAESENSSESSMPRSNSPLLLLKKGTSGGWNISNISCASRKRATPDTREVEPSSKRRLLTCIVPPDLRRAAAAGVTEASVSRYLTRKPMSIADLLRKFHIAKKSIAVNELQEVVSYIIKKLNPSHEIIQDKTMYFIPSETDVLSGTYYSTFGKDKNN